MPEVSMSLAEKIGQLFIVGFEGTEVTPEIEAWVSTYGWGGVIIFGRNVGSPAQVFSLTQGLQTAVRARGLLTWWARPAQRSLPATSVGP
jgi:beta-N-acetylhexosaminidase